MSCRHFKWYVDGSCVAYNFSPVQGKVVSLKLDPPPTRGQVENWINGMLIQDAMPNLPADQREFLISGCTPEDFNKLFPPEA